MKTKERVRTLLTNREDLRDDFMKTLANFWLNEISKGESAYNFLGRISRGEVTAPESIRRSWQQLQEVHENLRGKEYNKRHNIQEPEVRQNIMESKQEEQMRLV